MFEEKYKKFKKTIEDYDLIGENTNKIVIGMSGGKDAAIMTKFFMEYKKRNKAKYEIELIYAEVPYKLQSIIPNQLFGETLSEAQKKMLVQQCVVQQTSKNYWTSILPYTEIEVNHQLIDNKILKMNWSCMLCFHAKMQAFNKYLESLKEDNIVFACGWTKWDSHYTMITHLLKSQGMKWYEVKEKMPEKYQKDCEFLASFAAYPKLNIGIPNKNVYRINPLIEFDDTETQELVEKLNIPIVHDICDKLFGNTFEQDRRYISKYLEITSKNQYCLKLPDTCLLFSYKKLLQFMKQNDFIPPLKEIENLIYTAYNTDFEQEFRYLKK